MDKAQTRPYVSVIMPTYNRADLIGASIESVLSQTYKNLEFIIVNDASTDGTEEVILEYQQKDRRIRYIRNEENLRIVRSLNRALDAAQGKYIARIDDDDIWIDRRKLEKQVEFLENHKDYVIIGTGSIAIFENKKLKIKSYKPKTDKDIRDKMLLGCPFLHPSVVYRKNAIDGIGPYDESLKMSEDYDLWMRLGKIGKMYNLPEHSIQSLVGASNISHTKRREVLEHNLKLIKKYRNDYPNFYRAYFKNYLEYVDAAHPAIRRLLRPVYVVRRFILDKFGKLEVEKI